MAEFMELSVGCKVRCWSPDFTRKQSSRLAVISYIEEKSADLLFLDSSNDEEECDVDISRLFNPEIFESESFEETQDNDATTLKDRGNALFTKCKDFLAAEKMYLSALEKLGIPQSSYSVGSTVLILPNNPKKVLDLSPATVIDHNPSSGTYDIMIDDTEEDVTILAERIVGLAAHPSSQELQRSLWMNVARCLTKREQYGWAVRYSSYALACAQVLSNHKGILDALSVRAKLLLSAHKPAASRSDCQRLAALGDTDRSQSQLREVDAYMKDKAKSNRIMAKEIAQWVDKAMQRSGSGVEDFED